jgi:hypothetical protein
MPARLIIASIILIFLAASSQAGAAENRKQSPKPDQIMDEQMVPITILSIIPAQGEPGTSVTLSGSGFTAKTTAFLGANEAPTRVLGPKQLTFDIPRLQPGLYALFLKREDGTTSRAYNFSVLPLKPMAGSITPDTVYACTAASSYQAMITGQNFQPRSQVLFDGTAVGSRFVSPESLSFKIPRVAAGLHQVQVKNPEDTVSETLGLFVDSRPEIENVTIGQDYVTYYNLVIDGRNLQQDTVLVVTEESSTEITGTPPAFDVKRLRSGSGNAAERERLVYVNCNRLIYQRYPYSNVPKNFKVQVINSNGEESSVVQVSAP